MLFWFWAFNVAQSSAQSSAGSWQLCELLWAKYLWKHSKRRNLDLTSTQESELIPTAPFNLPLCREEQAWEGAGSHPVSAHSETFSLPITFVPVSFISPCHHWNWLNALISSACQRRRQSFQEGRKTAGKREKNLNCLLPSFSLQLCWNHIGEIPPSQSCCLLCPTD